MKKRDKLDPLVLASTALFLFLIFSLSNALAANDGNTFAYQVNYEDAIKVYDKAIEIDPQNSEAWYNKGLCLAELGDYNEAIKAFDEAIEISPQNTDAWVKKGLCFIRLSNYEEAIKAYDEVIEISPQNLNAWANKGACLEYLGNYEEAIEAFDKAIAINSQESGLWYNKGSCLMNLGNYEEAVKAFDKAIEIDSQDSDTWYNKGTCLAHLGKYNEAVEALDKAIEIDPQYSYALSLKEAILSKSNGLMTSLKSLFSNNNIFVEENDLLEYAQTYLKTYEDIITESNLTREDLGLFSFYQNYPYSVNATISNTNGASITFIPHSIDKNKVTRIPHPIEKLIPIINNEELNSPSIRGVSINGNNSNISVIQNIYGGNVSSISDMENYSFRDGLVYTNNSNNNSLHQLTNNAPIILGEGAYFNGLTYIDSNKVFRKGELIINGTLVLNDSKVIMKSNLKKDWTKEKAEEDVIDSIYKELVDEVLDYSKLTGIGIHEIERLITRYNERQTTGYYEINKFDKWGDRQAIFNTADKYNIPYESVLVELLDNKQEESSTDKVFNFMDRFNTVSSFITMFVLVIGWIKRKEILKKLKF